MPMKTQALSKHFCLFCVLGNVCCCLAAIATIGITVKFDGAPRLMHGVLLDVIRLVGQAFCPCNRKHFDFSWYDL